MWCWNLISVIRRLVNFKVVLREIRSEGVRWMKLALDVSVEGFLISGVQPSFSDNQ